MRLGAVLALLLGACGPAARPVAIDVPPAPPPPASAPELPPLPVLPPEPPPPPPPVPFDLDHAPRVKLKASPLQAAAPKPIGDKPKPRVLTEVARVKDKTADVRFTQRGASPYDPKRINDLRRGNKLPPGAPPGIPLSFEGAMLETIYESGGKLLLTYGPRWLAIVQGDKVEQVIDMDPPELPLTEDQRGVSDIHQSQFRDGVAYVCRGYNGQPRSRKGYVTALDVATGELRWRGPPLTCGGVVALVGDYVLTGYGEDVMPYQLKLLRRWDGALVQSIPNYGAALDILVDGDKAVVETFRHRITYELR